MNNPINTVLYSLLIIALFFGMSTIYLSCGGKKDSQPEKDLAEKVENVADTYTDDSFFEDEESEGQTQDANVDTKPARTAENTSKTSRSQTSQSTDDRTPPSPRVYTGRYMVIAGNYLLEDNADNMVKKLKAQGYNQSDKVVFDLSQYYTVIAGSYDSRAIANSISSELTAKGIDNYVLSRKE